MPVCVVKLCKNNTTRNKKDTGITYHQFPADPGICDRWAAIVRLSREERWWKPEKRSIICSVHFNDSEFYFTKGGLKRLSKGAVPQNELFLSSNPPASICNQPSTSTSAVVNCNKSEVLVEPSTSASVNDKTILTESKTPPLEDFPDIDYIFDTPRERKLEKELFRKTALQKRHGRIIKTLREKTRRLKRANCYFRSIIKTLKEEVMKNGSSSEVFTNLTSLYSKK